MVRVMNEELNALDKALSDQEVVGLARRRYADAEPYQSRLISKYQKAHHFYAPLYGDQWPEDLAQRPGKIHLSVNIVKAAVDVDSRLQALIPRISLVPDTLGENDRLRAEAAEKMMLGFLDLSGWDVWLPDLTKTKCLYGKGILKPYWNKRDNRPDVVIIENPANLRVGWGSSDYRAIDWAIYEYLLSPLEAMSQFPDVDIKSTGDKKTPFVVARGGGNHTDPLNQRSSPLPTDKNLIRTPINRERSQYEQSQVRVWDYWYKDLEGIVHNATLIEGQLATGPTVHRELPDIPFIIIENDHEPGSPEGVSTAEGIYDIQIEMNRAISHWAQLVADEIDPAWQLTGDNADSVPGGIVPKGGEIIAAGAGNRIDPIIKPVNQFPIQSLMQEFWNLFYKTTGLSEIVFGSMPSAGTSGRALAIQVESVANRMDPKRRRLYQGLREMLIFWTFMTEKVNPKVDVKMPDGTMEKRGVGDLFEGLRRWKIIAPELTPRDVIENTTNEINKINSRVTSLRSAMDNLGVDSPEDELKLIQLERSNPQLFPGDVQAWVAVLNMVQSMQAQQAQLQATQQALQAPQQAALGVSPLAASESGAAAAQNTAFEMQPALGQDMNQAGPTQPMTAPGGPSPEGSNAPGTLPSSLVRSTPTGQATATQQVIIPGRR
jgi:hypothetical protein